MSKTPKIKLNSEHLYFCGDIHGNFQTLKYAIEHLTNSCIIVCGDIGLGFQPEYEQGMLKIINDLCEVNNNDLILVAGNHDNPFYFETSYYNDRVKSIPSYSIVTVQNKNILCIGGGISIDRKIRTLNVSYWEDEVIKKHSKYRVKIDIIASHSSPRVCYPYKMNDIVLRYAYYDNALLDDIEAERQLLNKVFEQYQNTVEYWYYGHYHRSNSETIRNTKFILLNCGELWKHF